MDPIADMFANIKNAQAVSKETVSVPYSKIKLEIAKLLQKENLVKDAVRRGKKSKKNIEIELLYKNGQPVISGIKRISKPSCRVYVHAKNTKAVSKGRGMLILSTPKGVLNDKMARQEKVGGEVIGIVW